jgi:peptide/nickel transport system substrate-binding protein
VRFIETSLSRSSYGIATTTNAVRRAALARRLPIDRRAVAYALNVPQLVKAYGNPGTIFHDFIPPQQLYNIAAKAQVDAMLARLPQYPYSVAKARAEMAKSKYPSGFASFINCSTEAAGTCKVDQAIAQMVGKIGVTLTVKDVDVGTWALALYGDKKGTTANWTTFNIPSPDPSSYPSWMVGHRNVIYGGWDWAAYDPPGMDELLKEGVQTLNKAKRFRIYTKILTEMANDEPYVDTFIADYTMALKPQFKYPTFNGNYLRTHWFLEVRKA